VRGGDFGGERAFGFELQIRIDGEPEIPTRRRPLDDRRVAERDRAAELSASIVMLPTVPRR
jgi:hypothetical protein